MRKIAFNGLLTSLAIILSLIERFIPVNLVIPFPGIKLGFANIVTMFALFYLGFSSALVITVSRCILSSLFFGGMSSLMYSLAGALFALITMTLLKSGFDKLFSIIGISMGGAAAHNTGQIMIAAIMMKTTAVFAYLPLLLFAGIVTGFLTAFISVYLFSTFEKTTIAGLLK
ncbi:MAG: Gx transporter family protein [Clostridiaceae bacterium]|nr:Gx transporter family protein [Clostridiaceae bacterium]